MSIIITRDLLATFGTEQQLADAVTAFSAAVEEHKTTVGVPAPTAHPLIEAIVRQYGGAYEVEPEPEPEPEPDPVPILPTPSLCAIVNLHVEDGELSGISTESGFSFGFFVDSNVMWVYFSEAMSNADYGWGNPASTSGTVRVTDRQVDYIELTADGAVEPYDVSLQIYKVT